MTSDELKNELISAIMELTIEERDQLFAILKDEGLIREVHHENRDHQITG